LSSKIKGTGLKGTRNKGQGTSQGSRFKAQEERRKPACFKGVLRTGRQDSRFQGAIQPLSNFFLGFNYQLKKSLRMLCNAHEKLILDKTDSHAIYIVNP
jgi:hypothetical protein